MRNLYKFAALLLLLPVMFFVACNDDDEVPEPLLATLLFNPVIDPFEGIPGDIAATTVSVSAPDGLNALVVTKTVGDGTPMEYARITPEPEATVLQYEFEYVLVEAEIDEILYFSFEVDHDGAETTPKTITVETNSPPARSYTATLLYAPLGDNTSQSFFSTSTGLTYSLSDVVDTNDPISKDIDFGYYYGANDMASLSAPSVYPIYNLSDWSAKNATMFVSTTLTASDFNELSTFADIDDAYEGGSDDGKEVINLAEGDVVAFATDATKEGGSKKGVILVKAITGTYGQGDNIEIDVLVQEPAD